MHKRGAASLMIFFLALRNIIKNKKNSVIITALIAVITFVFFTGNSIISNADNNIREAFVDNLTGDVVLEKTGDTTLNLFGGNTPVIDSFFSIPVLPAHNAVMELVSSQEEIAGITSQVSGRAYLDFHSKREPVFLCGIDPETYFSVFPGIELKEGRFLTTGEYGAMITMERALKIERESGQFPIIGEFMLFTSGGVMGFKIREIPLVGIYSYTNPGQYLNEIILTDPQTVRVLNSIQVAGGSAYIPEDEKLNLLSVDVDDIFNTSLTTDENNNTNYNEFSIDALQSFLRENNTEKDAETGGDWNFILIRLKDKDITSAFINSLNDKLKSYGITAVNWRTSAGISAIYMSLIQSLFNIGIFLISIAGAIAVINIHLISVFRRTREMGTLRAIGASNSYIRSLILTESITIAISAGILGILGGIVFSRFIDGASLNISNNLIISMLGGQVLHMNFMPLIAFFSLLMAILLGFAASLYPLEAAVRIEPMAAVRRG
jgi:ABC-type lipoprotein release transport system permease subunit